MYGYQWLIVIGILAMAGCSQVREAYVVDSMNTLPKKNHLTPTDTGFVWNSRGELRANEESHEYGERLELAHSTTIARNSLINDLMRASDSICVRHKGSILANGSSLNAGLGILSTTTASLAAIFTPVATTAGLGASSAIFNSVRSEVDSNIYSGQFVNTIVMQIERNRTVIRNEIFGKMKQSIPLYSMQPSTQDINAKYATLLTNRKKLVALTGLHQEVEYVLDAIAQNKKGKISKSELKRILGEHEEPSKKILQSKMLDAKLDVTAFVDQLGKINGKELANFNPTDISMLHTLLLGMDEQIIGQKSGYIEQVEQSRKALETAAGAEIELSSYSVEEGIRDIGRYHWACSFANALASLSKEVAKPIQQNSAQIIERIRVLKQQKENVGAENQADVDAKIKELVLKLAEPHG